jgi:antitoxin (DNA-binding transcriptional repressor) of toxin-antitoxin stability system
MKSVGIKQLKARLSEYVRLARDGEIVLVSDRDEVVAEMGPPRHQSPEAGSIGASLDRLAARGQVTRAGHAKKGWIWSPPHLGLGKSAVRDILEDLRNDR